jgi:hypothetical protein
MILFLSELYSAQVWCTCCQDLILYVVEEKVKVTEGVEEVEVKKGVD